MLETAMAACRDNNLLQCKAAVAFQGKYLVGRSVQGSNVPHQRKLSLRGMGVHFGFSEVEES
jgi:hypothetical protein